jgi:acetyl esterase/lipase
MASNGLFDVEIQDVEYQRQGDQPWLARVYQPKGDGPFPTIIDVHGGAWNNGDRTNNLGVDKGIAERGVVVAALDFRQPPEAAYPASLADINLGIRWLKAHAADFKGTAKVGAFGNSSGGHQVVLTGLRPRDPRYAALPYPEHPELDATLAYVIAAWPVIDPLYRYRNVALPSGREDFINSHLAFWGSEAGMAEGSPQTIVEEDADITMPPILVTLKAGDDNHPLEMQERFIAAYRQRGGEIEVETFVGLPERRMAPGPEQPEAVRAVERMVDFIRRHS